LKKTERVMGSIRTNVNQAELNYCKHFGETGEFKKKTFWGKNVIKDAQFGAKMWY